MASPNIFPNGLGGATPGGLSSLAELYCSGTVRYVHSSGSDSYAGTERVRPLATIQQANTLSAANDIIVLLAGHTQSITTQVNFTQTGLTIIGEGLGAQRPTFTRDIPSGPSSNTDAGIMLSGAGQYIENVAFAPSLQTTSTPTQAGCIGVRETGTQIVNCYFVLGSSRDCAGIDFGAFSGGFADRGRIRDCGVVSVAADSASAPLAAVLLGQASDLFGLVISGLVANGGAAAWRNANSNTGGIRGVSAVQRLRATDLSLLGDTDLTLVTGSTGYIHVRDRSGSARVVWAA